MAIKIGRIIVLKSIPKVLSYGGFFLITFLICTRFSSFFFCLTEDNFLHMERKKENLSLRRKKWRWKNPTSAILSVWPPNSHCTYLYYWERTCQNFVLVDKPERQIWAVFWGRFYAHKTPRIKVLFTFLCKWRATQND